MIMSLDLGTSTGFCYGNGASVPQIGSIRMPSTGPDLGTFMAFFRDWFVPVCKRLDPKLVAFEAPVLPPPTIEERVGYKTRAVVNTNIHTTRKLQGLAAVLELMCFDLEVPCFEVSLNTAKKALTGNGHAQKSDMLAAARRQGLDLSSGPEAFDEADAFAAWLVAVEYHAKEHVPFWDRRLHGYNGR